jgi:hypothetical protein
VQARNLTTRPSDSWQHDVDHCQRRYLAALRSLAQVRKLALPALQVNIAEKQVNKVG